MGKKCVKIAHISDLHISDKLGPELENAEEINLTYSYGHDFNALWALDNLLNNNLDWDVLVISGDLTCAGLIDSFRWVKNWVEGEIRLENNVTLGLNLIKKNKPFIIVPGNHDRFDGNNKTQGKIDRFNKTFKEILLNHMESVEINEVKINFHLFDSSTEGGGFAFGEIKHFPPKTKTSNSIDIGVLHHHIVQSPKHSRNKFEELLNFNQVASYFFNSIYDAVMFGHTHHRYIDLLQTKTLIKHIPDRRKKNNIFRKILLNIIKFKVPEGDAYISKRERTKSGRYPRVSAYYKYLYIKDVLKGNVRGPSEYETLKHFYDQLDIYNDKYKEDMKSIMSNAMLVSMAPSACKMEERLNGINIIEFMIEDSKIKIIRGSYYDYVAHGYNNTKTKTYIM